MEKENKNREDSVQNEEINEVRLDPSAIVFPDNLIKWSSDQNEQGNYGEIHVGENFVKYFPELEEGNIDTEKEDFTDE